MSGCYFLKHGVVKNKMSRFYGLLCTVPSARNLNISLTVLAVSNRKMNCYVLLTTTLTLILSLRGNHSPYYNPVLTLVEYVKTVHQSILLQPDITECKQIPIDTFVSPCGRSCSPVTRKC